MNISIFHNPKCSKSRATLKLLNDQKINPEIILYLKNPPTETELSDILKKLDMAPQHLIRFKESLAKDLGISLADKRPDADWIKLMCKNPSLIERPIVITEIKAAIGRPPEKVLDIL